MYEEKANLLVPFSVPLAIFLVATNNLALKELPPHGTHDISYVSSQPLNHINLWWLTTVGLDDAGLDTIPPELASMPNLAILSLRRNNLKSLSNLPTLPVLQELYLGGYQLEEKFRKPKKPTTPILGEILAKHQRGVAGTTVLQALPISACLRIISIDLTDVPEKKRVALIKKKYPTVTYISE